jgi:hypothetical protein
MVTCGLYCHWGFQPQHLKSCGWGFQPQHLKNYGWKPQSQDFSQPENQAALDH